MADWMDIINFIVVVCGLTIAAMGLFFSVSVPYMKKNDRLFLTFLFMLLLFYTASDLASQISLVFLRPGIPILSKAAIFLESFFSSLCLPFLTAYILDSSGLKRKRNPYYAASIAIWLLYFILLCYTQVSDSIYYLTEDNVYHRGAYYPVLLVPPVVLMLINLVCLLQNRKRLSKTKFRAFSLYIMIPLICMLIQMMWYGLLAVILGTAVASACLLYSIFREQIDLYIRQGEELAIQKVNIMMLEMRPHFIYNTLTSIYYLCEQDSKKAQQVILDFSVYLRKNFTAISRNDTIPFTEELEHTKAYLSVEMARYEGRLFVEYDFDKTPSFQIPPLTLQPVVENSIKHGLDPELDPLHILIRVQDSANGHTITVQDNGLGFEKIKSDGPHIALMNIRERLKLLCDGTLLIGPRSGGGTSVTIYIPEIRGHASPNSNFYTLSLSDSSTGT